MKSARKLFAIAFSTILLASCGSSHLSGEYESRFPVFDGFKGTLRFHGSAVELEYGGSTIPGTYEIKDGKVFISFEGKDGIATLKVKDDGCLTKAGWGSFCKKP